MNTGEKPVPSQNNLLTTIGWRLGGQVTYCLEGSVFVAGAVVQWLRDGLGIIGTSADVERLAASVPDSGGVYFVPALVGLGAPHWDPYARGTILGLTRGTTAAHLARAALEVDGLSDLRRAATPCRRTPACELAELKVDGGASVNDLLMQFQADMLGVRVRRPVVAETTALGAAYLAGLAVGYWHDPAEIARNWALDREYRPALPRPGERPSFPGGERPWDARSTGRDPMSRIRRPGPGGSFGQPCVNAEPSRVNLLGLTGGPLRIRLSPYRKRRCCTKSNHIHALSSYSPQGHVVKREDGGTRSPHTTPPITEIVVSTSTHPQVAHRPRGIESQGPSAGCCTQQQIR